ncbi:atypical protein kinase C-like isoform X1 [Plodia interpunctella]|uniref:atypical protein kinase C-like isoform X1 n=1 Tax=Plodia interpunctella TaxID=58824 RepID=UPI003100B1D5
MMPVSQDNHTNDVRVKTVYSGDVMITYIKHNITLEEFTQEMVAICRFPPDQVFTMKWVDEEGDPCTISTQLELDEALRLYELNRDSELTVHGKSSLPYESCIGVKVTY